MNVKGPTEKSEEEMYERTGLWLILKMFHYFGFRLLNHSTKESWVNRSFVGFTLVVTCVTFAISSYIMTYTFIRADGSLDLENAGFYVFVGSGYSTMMVTYFIGLAKAKQYSVLMRSLASAIDGIPNQDQKRLVVRRIKKTAFVWCVFLMLAGSASTFASFFLGQNRISVGKAQTEVFFYLVTISSTSNIIWFLTVGAFYLFTNAIILTVCGILVQVIDAYLKPQIATETHIQDLWTHLNRWDVVREEEMNQNMVYHKKMSLIVEVANSTFGLFLLLSLAVEMTICIAYVKLLTIKDGSLSFGAYTNSLHVILLVLKAFACANVNDKLKESILLKKLPDSSYFSNKQVTCYILYQNEQQISRTQLTYGKIFPVKKTFIFTIAGTALTYALVLQGMGQLS